VQHAIKRDTDGRRILFEFYSTAINARRVPKPSAAADSHRCDCWPAHRRPARAAVLPIPAHTIEGLLDLPICCGVVRCSMAAAQHAAARAMLDAAAREGSATRREHTQ
jgi:hypothetical protein